MIKLKTVMVMNGAKGLLLDLLDSLAARYYVEEQEDRILRCVKDLSDCVKESDENVTQEGLCNIDDMQAEIDRLIDDNYELKEIIRQLINDVEFGEFVNLDEAKKALKGESEEK